MQGFGYQRGGLCVILPNLEPLVNHGYELPDTVNDITSNTIQRLSCVNKEDKVKVKVKVYNDKND